MFTLNVHGVEVVKVFPVDKLPEIRASIDSALSEAPYFVPNPPCRVLGKFQALGDPFSMWHPSLLSIRKAIHEQMVPFLRSHVKIASETKNLYLEVPKVCSVMDRLMVRPHGVKIDGEAWHRDVGRCDHLPKGGSALEFFGGFTNLSDEPQRFRCVPFSHQSDDGKLIDVRTISSGFARIPPEKHSECEERADDVVVKPGEHIIFHQHIIHTIIKNTNLKPMYRMFHGFIISDSPQFSEYIFGGEPGLKRLSMHQAVPQLPSGQLWTIFSKRHIMLFKDKPFKLLEDASEKRTPPQRKMTPGTLDQNLRLIFVSSYVDEFGDKMHMPSMFEMNQKLGYQMLPEISDCEIDHYRPQNLFP